MEEESSSVSFTTANGKEVSFQAKKGRSKAAAKKKVTEHIRAIRFYRCSKKKSAAESQFVNQMSAHW